VFGNKQQRVAEAITRAGLLEVLRGLHDRGRKAVSILAYHRIATIDDPDAYPLDLGLVSATAQEFDAQMRSLREFATPVSLDDIADAVTHGRTLPDRPVAVTFDDSFSDTFEVAFPALQRHGIPATVFVATDHVEDESPFWFEITAHLMLRVPPRAITFEQHPEGLPVDDDIAARRKSIVILHRLLKTCANQRRRQLVDGWRATFARHLDVRATDLSRPVSREQILQMSRNGVDFGSHTVTHPNLALAAPDDIARELTDSRVYLEDLLGRRVRSLAYPFGTPDTYDDRVKAAAGTCGYELAVAYRQGVNWLGTLDAFELRRIGISPGISPAQFRAMLTLPAWFHPRLEDH
jgi:peptidoglycan/xylan/chitin deacetylase (PgdA/CDA1 family)